METAEWLKYIEAADYLSSDDTTGVEEAAQIRKVADKYGKKVVIGSTGRVTSEIGDQMAKYGDVYVIQAQKWHEEDSSPNLDSFLNTLKTAVEKVKSGNPNISIWIQIGRRFERGGGTSEDFVKAYAAVLKTYPNYIDAMHPFIAGDAPEGSGSGSEALFKFVETYR